MNNKREFFPILRYFYLFFLSFFTSAADIYYQGGNNGLAALLAKAIVYYVLFFGFFLIMEKGLGYCQLHPEKQRWTHFFTFSKRNILRLSFLFFFIYFFYLLVFYPGATTGDTVYQIEDFVTGTSPMPYPVNYSTGKVSALMIDHHPVMTTIIFSLFYKIGLLSGNANFGLFLFNLLQIIAMAFLFASIVCFMDSLHVPKTLALISVVFYVSPVIASFAITMSKDTLFSFCFVLYYLVYTSLIIQPVNGQHQKNKWTFLIFLSLLISLTNKKGLYIALFSNLCLIFVISKKNIKYALLAALIPCFTSFILLQYLVFPSMRIAPGGKQEILGPAFQQTALALLECPENYSEAEKKLYFSLFDLESEDLENVYNPTLTDPLKNRYRQESSNEQIRAFLKMWFSHSFRESGIYIRATLSVSGGYIAPHKMFNVYQFTPYSEILGAFSQPGKTEVLRNNLGALIYWLENIPVFSMFCQDSFYVFWIPAFGLYFFLKKRQWQKIVLLVPLAANLFFLLIGPTCITRYGLCQLYVFPIVIALVIFSSESRNTSSGFESPVSAQPMHSMLSHRESD